MIRDRKMFELRQFRSTDAEAVWGLLRRSAEEDRETGRRQTDRFLFIDFSKALGLVVGLLALLGLADASPAQAALLFERPNGSELRFQAVPRVWCAPWAEDVARPSIHVAAKDARRGWELSAVRRDLEIGERIDFPNEFVWNRPRGAQLFVAAGRLEASSAEEESSGSIAFSRATCRLGSVVEFSVDAVLGSELFEGDPVRVSGTYRGRVSKPPYR
jgi:hypothetical protein